jgi:hypothetical protein
VNLPPGLDLNVKLPDGAFAAALADGVWWLRLIALLLGLLILVLVSRSRR